MKAKKARSAKLIIMGILFITMALAATAGIVAVLALTSRSITSNVNITYTAVDIDGEVEAAYRIGDSGTWTSMNGSSPYRFSADDQTSNKQMNPANIELTSQNRYVEFRYIFRNYGHVDYTAILSLNEVDESNNIKLDYKYNDKSYTPTGYGLVIEGTNSPVAGKVQTNEDGEEYVEMTYYVKASVKQLTRDANYQSDFFWLLENYEAQPGEETIRLATSNYTDNGDGTYSASYSGANISVASMMTESSTSSIENIWNVPSRFGSASVTKITKGDDLPANTKVVLSDSITTIEEGTFSNYSYFDNTEGVGDKGLVEIALGNGIRELPMCAFTRCVNLRRVTLQDTLTKIGIGSFYGCTSLKDVSIPYGVTEINSDVFNGCTSLESIVIPNSVTKIHTIAFGYCSNLKSVTLSSNLTSITMSSFTNCTSLTSITIPDSVTEIQFGAFQNCTGLKNITIGAGVTSIGDSAFEGCTSVEVLNYNASVTTAFTSSPFSNLGRNANNTIVNINSTVIPGYLLDQCIWVDEINISDNVTSIGDNAFQNCSGLTSVVIPNSVTSIGSSAFQYCSGLTSVEIGSGVTSIGDNAFQYCSGLTSVVIPNRVTNIGSSAFSSCYGLLSVVIGSGVTSIGYDAFSSCSILVEIYDLRTTQMTAGDYGTNSYAKILSSGANSVVHTDSNGIQYFEYETGKYKVMGYTGTETEITIPSTCNGKSVTEIRDYAFSGCFGITSIVIPDSVTILGDSLFSESVNLRKVVIGSGVTKINETFSMCYGLTSVTIGSGVTSIAKYAFAGCPQLVEIYNLSALSITPGSYGTANDVRILKSGDKSVVATDDVSGCQYFEYETGKYKLFGVFAGVEEVIMPSTFNGIPITTIRKNAFFSAYMCKKLVISNSVINIETEAFFDAYLEELVVGENVSSIASGAFTYCYNLTSIEFKNPNGWWCADTEDATSGTALTISATDFSGNATLFRSTNSDKYWKRG